ncbi:MAG: hypothetical protein CM1200mP3_09440 [Chloroflexota bacterium]|nr:MAG: hypothetical protein CM1200mP3_09440 [Chloroflexota bacterium]
MNQWEMMGLFAREADCDCFLLAGRYTLLDYSALYEFLPLCESKGISVILGGPFNSGILALICVHLLPISTRMLLRTLSKKRNV